jgi:hypothetical protein
MTQKVNDLLNEYFADPNCCAELWISGEDVTPEEREDFINGATGRIPSHLEYSEKAGDE